MILAILVSSILCSTGRAEVYLEANFDDKAVGEAIGAGGAELGEPISVSPHITATVQSVPMPTPFLEIQDNDDYSAGSAAFEFLGNEEVTTGFVDISANLWFPEYEQFFLRVREQGGAAAVFLSPSRRRSPRSSVTRQCSPRASRSGTMTTTLLVMQPSSSSEMPKWSADC